MKTTAAAIAVETSYAPGLGHLRCYSVTLSSGKPVRVLVGADGSKFAVSESYPSARRSAAVAVALDAVVAS